MQRRQRQQQKQDFILHLQVWVFRLPAPQRRLVRRLHLMVLKHFLWKQREAVAMLQSMLMQVQAAENGRSLQVQARTLAEPPYSWSLTLTSGPEWTEHWRHQGRKAKRLNLQAQAPRASQHLQTQEPRNRLPHDLLRCLM